MMFGTAFHNPHRINLLLTMVPRIASCGVALALAQSVLLAQEASKPSTNAVATQAVKAQTKPQTVFDWLNANGLRFQRAFDDQAVFIPAAAQTRQRLTFLAVKLAVKHQADPRSLYQTLHEMRPAAERGLVSVEWRRVFPYAPKWSPARYWKAPVVVLGRPRMKASRWGTIRWQWRFGSTEVRVQNRRLFPNAPQWSPARKLSLPALRLLRKTDRVKETVRSEKSWQKKQQKKKAKKQSQSQSQSH